LQRMDDGEMKDGGEQSSKFVSQPYTYCITVS
jgi:hypothetical protein